MVRQEHSGAQLARTPKAGRGSKRALEIDMSLVSTETTGVQRRRRDLGINFKLYRDRELVPLLLKGVSAPDAESQIEKSWKLLLMDKESDKECIDGEWLVYEFAGVVREKVEQQMATASKLMRVSVEGAGRPAPGRKFLEPCDGEGAHNILTAVVIWHHRRAEVSLHPRRLD